MKRLLFLIGLSQLFISLHAATITLATDSWVPYSGKAGSEKEGFMVEIAKMALKEAGHTVVYKNIPWARAITDCRKGKIEGIVGSYVSDAPDFVFPEEEAGRSVNMFYVLKDSKWQYKGVESLDGKILGGINGYSYGEVLDKYIARHKGNSKKVQLIAGNSAKQQNLTKMQKGRIHIFVEDSAVMAAFLKKHPKFDKIKSAGIANDGEKVFIAFSPNNTNSKQFAKDLSEGIKAMRKDGRLKKILDKYGVEDWK